MPSQPRIIFWFCLLIAAGGYYLYANPALVSFLGITSNAVTGKLVDKSDSLPFDSDTKAAIRNYFDGVTVTPRENELNHAIQLDHGVGRPQLSRGEYKEAHRTYQKVLAISWLQGSLMGVGIALNVIADIAEKAGDPNEALYATFLAYKAAQELKNKEEIGVVELSFAHKLRSQHIDLALPWLLRAKENLKDTRYKEDYIRLLPALAGALRYFHENDKASALYNEAWTLAQSLGDTPGQKWAKWETGLELADDLIRRKQFEKATDILNKTRSFFTSSEKTSAIYIEVLHRLARANAAVKKNEAAKRLYLAAYSFYQLARLKAPGEEGRMALDRRFKHMIDDFVDHYQKTGTTAAALALLETSKAPTLSEIVEDAGFEEARKRWRQMELTHALELTRLLEGDSPELQLHEKALLKVAQLVVKHMQENQELQTELRLKDTVAARVLSVEGIRNLQSQMSPDTALLSFYLFSDRSAVFVITRDRIQSIPLPHTYSEYRRAVEQLRVALASPYNDFYREPARFLFRGLIAPVVARLSKEVKILVYSADGPISRIPLAALMDGESYLGEKYAIYSIPSLRFLNPSFGKYVPSVEQGILCVDPQVQNARLPFQAETGKALQNLYNKKISALSGQDCTSKNLTAAIRNTKDSTFLYLGARGNLYPEKPGESSVWLAPEQGSRQGVFAWNAKAIASTDMSHVELVTISTAEAELTEQKYEREALGILRPFFFAGAKRVLAPLWFVEDQPSAEFLEAFYRLYAKKIAAPASLQQAQVAFLRHARYRHPHYWASFVLTEGR